MLDQPTPDLPLDDRPRLRDLARTLLSGKPADTYHARRAVLIDYANWRGERRWRLVEPLSVEFAATDYHPGRQWVLQGEDLEKREIRSFALKDVRAWEPAVLEGPSDGR